MTWLSQWVWRESRRLRGTSSRLSFRIAAKLNWVELHIDMNLGQWFSNFGMHKNHLTRPLKYRFLDPTSRAFIPRSRVGHRNQQFSGDSDPWLSPWHHFLKNWPCCFVSFLFFFSLIPVCWPVINNHLCVYYLQGHRDALQLMTG